MLSEFVRYIVTLAHPHKNSPLLSEIHPVTAGAFDCIKTRDGVLVLSGWMFSPVSPIESLRIQIDQEELPGDLQRLHREDLRQTFPQYAAAEDSGFEFRGPLPPEQSGVVHLLEVLGFCGTATVARLSVSIRRDFSPDTFPSPPVSLMERVTLLRSAEAFWSGGYKCYEDFFDAIKRHRDPATLRTILDWGCGPGRITAMIHAYSGIPEVHGCDVDREAIDWGSEALPGCHLSAISAFPPTSYRKNTFDAVVSFSVFTHLSPHVQTLWLKEMKRVLTADGLFLASVHGEFAAACSRNFDEVEKDIHRQGYWDYPVQGVDNFTPKDYYRLVYQSRDFTLRTWAKEFAIIEYIERGVGAFHDLVVMRKL